MREIVNIHGKEYETVASRLARFRKDNPSWGVTTKLVHQDEKHIIMRALIIKHDGDDSVLIATGHAEEVRGSTQINRTSALENCESSAIGRALAAAGYDQTNSIASADEVQNAILQQQNPPGAGPNSTLAPPPSTSLSPPPSPPQQASAPTGGGGDKETLTVKFSNVGPETFNRKSDGKEMTKWVANTTCGRKLTTFNERIGGQAQGAFNAGQECEIDAGPVSNYGDSKLLRVTALDTPVASTQPVNQDDVPF
jgi:hypothetical protein